MPRSEVLQGYEAAAAELIERFDAVSTAELLAPVRAHLPRRPARVLDVGAGAGRDAVWFAAQGHDVTAAEPVAAFVAAGQARRGAETVRWERDALPDLPRTRALGRRYDCILLSAVWQHLEPAERREAMATLWRLAAPGGRLILSLRQGPAPPSRLALPVSVAETLRIAEAQGFTTLLQIGAPSVQAANRREGVRWTWLVLAAPDPSAAQGAPARARR